jgi:hypothetical protein
LPFGRFSRRSEPGMGPWESAAARGGIVSETRLVAVEEQTATLPWPTGSTSTREPPSS